MLPLPSPPLTERERDDRPALRLTRLRTRVIDDRLRLRLPRRRPYARELHRVRLEGVSLLQCACHRHHRCITPGTARALACASLSVLPLSLATGQGM